MKRYITEKFKYLEPLVLILGSLFISLWTLARFFLKTPTFDLVGQQNLAYQWSKGFHAYSVIGPTNYIWKMFLLYMPLNAIPGSPKVKLMILTVLINIIVFVSIYVILKKLLRLFMPTIGLGYYLAIFWFALISGSVYWIQFTNSRNLELVGGLLLVYLIIRNIKKENKPRYAILILLSSLLFFADPLQLYMSAVPGLAYLGLFTYKNKKSDFVRYVFIVLSVVVGLGLSKIIIALVSKSTGAVLIAVTTHTNGYNTIQTVIHGTVPALKQMGRLYVGGHELGWLIEGMNLVMVAGVLLVGLYYFLGKKINKQLVYMCLSFWLLGIFFYIVSGQSLQTQTSRYLIVTVPIFIVYLTAVMTVDSKLRRYLIAGLIALIFIDMFGVIKVFDTSTDQASSSDAHVQSAISFMKDNGYKYGYSSADLALPADYFSNQSITLLPLTCGGQNNLAQSYLFFDKSFYQHAQLKMNGLIPVIIDGSTINNYPNSCGLDSAYKIFGTRPSMTHLSDGSLVLIYSASEINLVIGH